MSRYLQKDIHDDWVEMLDDPDRCRLLIDDVCCCHKSEFCADFPDEEDCKECPYFEAEKENS